jgi:hypothetical protein
MDWAFPGGWIISDVGIFNNEAALPEQGRVWQFVKLLSTGTYWYWNGTTWVDTGVSFSASWSSADLWYYSTIANLPSSPQKWQYAKVIDNGNGESTIFFYSWTVWTDTGVKWNEGNEWELIEMYLWGMYKALGNLDVTWKLVVSAIATQPIAANLNMTATLAAWQTLAVLTNMVNIGNIPANIIFNHLSIANFNNLANNMSFY